MRSFARIMFATAIPINAYGRLSLKPTKTKIILEMSLPYTARAVFLSSIVIAAKLINRTIGTRSMFGPNHMDSQKRVRLHTAIFIISLLQTNQSTVKGIQGTSGRVEQTERIFRTIVSNANRWGVGGTMNSTLLNHLMTPRVKLPESCSTCTLVTMVWTQQSWILLTERHLAVTVRVNLVT